MHKTINGALGWRFDIDEAVVRANFKMLSRVLVDKGTAQHAKTPDTRRQWYWPGHFGTSAPDRLNDFGRRTVQTFMVKALKFYTNTGC